jgi:phytanoyl-CoA hydroxylase
MSATAMRCEEILSSNFGSFSSDHCDAFHRDGVVCVERFVPENVIAILKATIEEYVAEERARRQDVSAGITNIFNSATEDHTGDRYFLESGDKIRFFLEKGHSEISLNSINKVAHALHTDGGVFQSFSGLRTFGGIARRLGRLQPSIVQSMYIVKAPRVGTAVVAHQDSTWIKTTPFSCLGLWVALDDCTTANGCLHALLGSHRTHPVTALARLNDQGTASVLSGHLPEVPLTEMHPLECTAGSLVVFSGELIHASADNTSDRSRHALVNHVVDDECCWDTRNWFGKNLARLAI